MLRSLTGFCKLATVWLSCSQAVCVALLHTCHSLARLSAQLQTCMQCCVLLRLQSLFHSLVYVMHTTNLVAWFMRVSLWSGGSSGFSLLVLAQVPDTVFL